MPIFTPCSTNDNTNNKNENNLNVKNGHYLDQVHYIKTEEPRFSPSMLSIKKCKNNNYFNDFIDIANN